jgi:polar amino acid transport system substrate-binding protein
MRLFNRISTVAAVLAALAFGGHASAQSCTPKLGAADLITAGTLQLSINPTLPPQQYVDEKGELQGLNVELARALGAKLCLKTEFVRMDFPAMVPALRAGRFDGIDTGMFWTDERSKLMFMVPYAQQAIGVFATDTSKLELKSIEDLSGKVAGIEIGTYQERKTKEANEAMVAKGLKPIELRTFSTATEATAALRAGQVDAVIIVEEAARAISKQKGMKLLLTGFGGSDITFAFRNKATAEAAAAAFTTLRKEGVYDALFDKFGMTRLPPGDFAIRGPGPGAS